MNLKLKLKELAAQHAEQAAIYQQAEQTLNVARTNLIKLEGAMEILQAQISEVDTPKPATSARNARRLAKKVSNIEDKK